MATDRSAADYAMTRYLIDTSTLIELSKGLPAVQAGYRTLETPEIEIGIYAVVVAEFFSGIPSARREVWSLFARELRFWPTSPGAAFKAGSDRFDLARRGRRVSASDALIAAVALEIGATVLTDNARDFLILGVDVRSLRHWSS